MTFSVQMWQEIIFRKLHHFSLHAYDTFELEQALILVIVIITPFLF